MVVVAGMTEHCQRMSEIVLDRSLNLDEHLCKASDMVSYSDSKIQPPVGCSFDSKIQQILAEFL